MSLYLINIIRVPEAADVVDVSCYFCFAHGANWLYPALPENAMIVAMKPATGKSSCHSHTHSSTSSADVQLQGHESHVEESSCGIYSKACVPLCCVPEPSADLTMGLCEVVSIKQRRVLSKYER